MSNDSPARRFLASLGAYISDPKRRSAVDKHNTKYGRPGDPKAPGDQRYPNAARPPHREIGGTQELPTQKPHGNWARGMGKQTMMIVLRKLAKLYPNLDIPSWNEMLDMSLDQVRDLVREQFGEEGAQYVHDVLPIRSQGKNVNVDEVDSSIIRNARDKDAGKPVEGPTKLPKKPKVDALGGGETPKPVPAPKPVSEPEKPAAPKPAPAPKPATAIPAKPKANPALAPEAVPGVHKDHMKVWQELREEALMWLADIDFPEDLLDEAYENVDQLVDAVDLNYEGGWLNFVRAFHDPFVHSNPELFDEEFMFDIEEKRQAAKKPKVPEQPTPKPRPEPVESTPQPEPDFKAIEDAKILSEPTADDLWSIANERGKKVSTGMVVLDGDKVWIVEPRNHFGGVEHAFPKGRLEPDLTPQQNAHKEVWEESGLEAEVINHVGIFEGTTTINSFYLARRTGGSPTTSDETQDVKLVTFEEAAKLFNMDMDKNILIELQNQLGFQQASEELGIPVSPMVGPSYLDGNKPQLAKPVATPVETIEDAIGVPLTDIELGDDPFANIELDDDVTITPIVDTATEIPQLRSDFTPADYWRLVDALTSGGYLSIPEMDEVAILAMHGALSSYAEGEATGRGYVQTKDVGRYAHTGVGAMTAMALAGVRFAKENPVLTEIKADISKLDLNEAEKANLTKSGYLESDITSNTGVSFAEEIASIPDVVPSEFTERLLDEGLTPAEIAAYIHYLNKNNVEYTTPDLNEHQKELFYDALQAAEEAAQNPDKVKVNGKLVDRYAEHESAESYLRHLIGTPEEIPLAKSAAELLRYGALHILDHSDIEYTEITVTDEDGRTEVRRVPASAKLDIAVRDGEGSSLPTHKADEIEDVATLMSSEIEHRDVSSVAINSKVANLGVFRELEATNGYSFNIFDVAGDDWDQYYWRVMGEDAYQDMLLTNEIRSKGYKNYADQGAKIHFHENPWMAASYADVTNDGDFGTNKRFIMVRIPKFEFADRSVAEGSEVRDNGQAAFSKPIPIEAVDKIIELRPSVIGVPDNASMKLLSFPNQDIPIKPTYALQGLGGTKGLVSVEGADLSDFETMQREHLDVVNGSIGGHLLAAKELEIKGLTDRNLDPNTVAEVFAEYFNGEISRNDILEAMALYMPDDVPVVGEVRYGEISLGNQDILRNVLGVDTDEVGDPDTVVVSDDTRKFVSKYAGAAIERIKEAGGKLTFRFKNQLKSRLTEYAKDSGVNYDPALVQEAPDGKLVDVANSGWSTDLRNILPSDIVNNNPWLNDEDLYNLSNDNSGRTGQELRDLMEQVVSSPKPVYYRGVTAEELAEAQRTGVFRTMGAGNFGDERGVWFGDANPWNAIKYAKGEVTDGGLRANQDVYIVAFSDPGGFVHHPFNQYDKDGVKIGHKDEYALKDDVTEVGVPTLEKTLPISAVEGIFAMRTAAASDHYINQNEVIGSVDARIENGELVELSGGYGPSYEKKVSPKTVVFKQIPADVLDPHSKLATISTDARGFASLHPASYITDKPISSPSVVKGLSVHVRSDRFGTKPPTVELEGRRGDHQNLAEAMANGNIIMSTSVNNMIPDPNLDQSETGLIDMFVGVRGTTKEIADKLSSKVTTVNGDETTVLANPVLFSDAGLDADGKLVTRAKEGANLFWTSDLAAVTSDLDPDNTIYAVMRADEVEKLRRDGIVGKDNQSMGTEEGYSTLYFKSAEDAMRHIDDTHATNGVDISNTLHLVAMDKGSVEQRTGTLVEQSFNNTPYYGTYSNIVGADVQRIVEVQPDFITMTSVPITAESAEGSSAVDKITVGKSRTMGVSSINPIHGASRSSLRNLGSLEDLNNSVERQARGNAMAKIGKKIADALKTGKKSKSDIRKFLRLNIGNDFLGGPSAEEIAEVDPESLPTHVKVRETARTIGDALLNGDTVDAEDVLRFVKEDLNEERKAEPFNYFHKNSTYASHALNAPNSLSHYDDTGETLGGGVFDASKVYEYKGFSVNTKHMMKNIAPKDMNNPMDNGGHIEALAMKQANTLGIGKFFPHTQLVNPTAVVGDDGTKELQGFGSLMTVMPNTMTGSQAGINNYNDLQNHLIKKYIKEYREARASDKTKTDQAAIARAVYEAQMLGVYDYIAGNPDRHSENILVDKDTGDIYWIDNGMVGRGTLSSGSSHDSFRPPVESLLPEVEENFKNSLMSMSVDVDEWNRHVQKALDRLDILIRNLRDSGDDVSKIEAERNRIRQVIDTWPITANSGEAFKKMLENRVNALFNNGVYDEYA